MTVLLVEESAEFPQFRQDLTVNYGQNYLRPGVAVTFDPDSSETNAVTTRRTFPRNRGNQGSVRGSGDPDRSSPSVLGTSAEGRRKRGPRHGESTVPDR